MPFCGPEVKAFIALGIGLVYFPVVQLDSIFCDMFMCSLFSCASRSQSNSRVIQSCFLFFFFFASLNNPL